MQDWAAAENSEISLARRSEPGSARSLRRGRSEDLAALLEREILPRLAAKPRRAAAARKLGELWARDDCDFLDVTLAMGELGDLAPREGAGAARAPSFALEPSATHVFSADVASHCFRLTGRRMLRSDFDKAPAATSPSDPRPRFAHDLAPALRL